MDVWTATRIILEKNPGLKRKFLLPKVRKKTGLGHSAVHEEWRRLVDYQKKLYRVKGCYYLKDPKLNAHDRLDMEWEAWSGATLELMEVNEDNWTPQKDAEVRAKYRRVLGLQ